MRFAEVDIRSILASGTRDRAGMILADRAEGRVYLEEPTHLADGINPQLLRHMFADGIP